MHKFRDTNVEESLHRRYPFDMPQAALAKFPFPIDPRRSPSTLNHPHDARRRESGPEPDDTHQQLPVGLSSIHRYSTFRIHDVSLPDARFEEIITSVDVCWLIGSLEHANICSIVSTQYYSPQAH